MSVDGAGASSDEAAPASSAESAYSGSQAELAVDWDKFPASWLLLVLEAFEIATDAAGDGPQLCCDEGGDGVGVGVGVGGCLCLDSLFCLLRGSSAAFRERVRSRYPL